jgi:hypothetical protein
VRCWFGGLVRAWGIVILSLQNGEAGLYRPAVFVFYSRWSAR